jgi:hypothetical protein
VLFPVDLVKDAAPAGAPPLLLLVLFMVLLMAVSERSTAMLIPPAPPRTPSLNLSISFKGRVHAAQAAQAALTGRAACDSSASDKAPAAADPDAQ